MHRYNIDEMFGILLNGGEDPVLVKGLFDNELNESQLPTGLLHSHILDQLSNGGSFKFAPKVTSREEENTSVEEKKRLDCTVSITDLTDIDPISESFSVKFRLFLMWKLDLEKEGLSMFIEDLLASGERYVLKDTEVDEFEKITNVPLVSIFNATSIEKLDERAGVRIYGNNPKEAAVLWNMGYTCTCKELFELHNFPFDLQDLQIELRLNDAKTWDKYNLTVNIVQFHKSALELTEWALYEPEVVRGSPSHKTTTVKIKARRLAMYYVQNIVLTMSMLSIIGLLCYGMEPDNLGDRLSTMFTLILTVVAFKLVLAQNLPKVAYNTLIDWYMMASFMSLTITCGVCVIPSLYDDEDDQHHANRVALYFSAILVVATILFWCSMVLRVKWTHSSQGTKEITAVEKKNWYSLRYSSPAYLPSE